ncbi:MULTISPECIES: hypothetical protein [Pseudonocardia]|uniref:Uncharacterized protein n=2 Tax=Pseudonocardia TaxID=1847 RepID=A0A1Y2N7Z1_PSEAH|nr:MULTISPECIES: hypothetical protein [Pseudonocardia]OSY43563.1 hypothetical protein BG845_00506 [Pseudonocardia autotrophica]TDN73446.1 hypothetical protein C8E95_2543 [Pseudonocardia autotrophica]BBG04186.1 hypothetical protein Pdca_53950 [Pseudonocardia autotrophica]GEC25517.1 hypothetical protein PSA01_25460 [Pseudonocardia saturnea]
MAVDWTTVDRNDPAARQRAIAADMAEQHAKKPLVNASGSPLPYAEQPERYCAVVTREAHEAAHGAGPRASHHIGRDRV